VDVKPRRRTQPGGRPLDGANLIRGRLPTLGPDTLTRGIGLRESITPEVRVEALLPNDGVLVTTDGLTSVVDDDTIAPPRCGATGTQAPRLTRLFDACSPAEPRTSNGSRI
jgi:serine/threonine protein phosphatase PrpC